MATVDFDFISPFLLDTTIALTESEAIDTASAVATTIRPVRAISVNVSGIVRMKLYEDADFEAVQLEAGEIHVGFGVKEIDSTASGTTATGIVVYA